MFLVSIAKKLQEQSRRLQVANPLACLGSLRVELIEVQAMAELKGILALSGPLRRVLLLCDIAEILAPDQPQESASIIALSAEGLGRMAGELLSPESSFDMAWVVRESDRLWGRYLDLLRPLAGAHVGRPAQADVGDLDAPPAIDLPRLLGLLGVSTTPARKSPAGSRPLFEIDDEEIPPAISSAQLLKVLLKQPVENKSDGVSSQRPGGPVITTPPSPAPQSRPSQTDLPREPQPAAPVEARPAPVSGPKEKFSGPLADPATRLAFREDSENLTERIGSLLPELERGEQTPSTLRELGRCLHTLKGAAGAVGLGQLAEFVHRLEDLNQDAIGTTGPVNSELLLGAHDLLLQLEHVIVHLTDSVPGDPDATVDHADAVADDAVSLVAPASPSSSVLLGDAVVSDVDETVRVPIARLGELMDLVAELLVLNGPRSSLATRVKDFASTVRSSRNRLAGSIDQLCELHAGKSIEEAQPPDQAADSADRDQEFLGVVRHLSEQGDDLLILAENLRGVAVPMADDADIAARLTRHLWDLLHEIRVVPIRPLLQRLARVARAAAKIEGKQVQVVLEGEDALLDRLVQDKVFEPLLHIVRNAVGHGIEQPADRTAAGKDFEGTIQISAVQDEDTLTFTVRDDGRGLDYATIERRARDLGLLQRDEKPDVERLREFVFRSGFSTRAGADALSGRGVGMDIVSSEVSRLQGTVRLQSEPGRGTSVTVRLPARISLEQAMVVSVDGQHFALPLKSVDRDAAAPEGEPAAISARGQSEPLCARGVLGYPARPPGVQPVGLPVLIGREVRELLVDKIEGPRELVARPLNPLLADHPVVSGTSLAADGELVLLLDPNRLATYQNRLPIQSLGRTAAVLVVDDSISVRRTLVNYLTALGLEVDEAGDGVEALKFMKERAYRLVITDLDMPRKDGFQLLADLEKDPKLATTPVIVSSARFDEKTRQSVLRLGARAVLPKPVGMEKLAEAIAPLISVAG